jgi:hypothetical protein
LRRYTEALGGLTALMALHLGGNQLTSVPAALGKAVKVEPIKPVLKSPGSILLKSRYDGPLSNSGFHFILRHYSLGG